MAFSYNTVVPWGLPFEEYHVSAAFMLKPSRVMMTCCDSLNVAMAAGVLLYEIYHQVRLSVSK
jgi:tRNA(Leu) C34 or U34 (ribose-2'-O)-methylase TrmL